MALCIQLYTIIKGSIVILDGTYIQLYTLLNGSFVLLDGTYI